MVDRFSPESIASQLSSVVQPDEFLLWVGSGISLPVYRNWRHLLTELCAACSVAPPTEGEVDSLIDKAEECRIKDSAAYHDFLRTKFEPHPQLLRRAAHYLLRMRFKGYLTTNFDALLEFTARTVQGVEPNVYFYPRQLPPGNLGSDPRPIYHLHGHPRGCTDEATNFVLARSEFNEAYQSTHSSLAIFLKAVLTTVPVLFVGCELREPQIQQVFKEMRSMLNWSRERSGVDERPPRYMLLESRSQAFLRQNALDPEELSPEQEGAFKQLVNEEDADEERLSFFDIKVIRYDPVDERHIGFDEICEGFCTLREDGVRPSISGPVELPE